MSIESSIQQNRPFRNPWQKTTVNLLFTHGWLTDHLRRLLQPHGITLQQYNVLRILRGNGGPLTTSAIRERLLDKMADTSRLVDRLHQKGLVQREVCANDKRLVDITLSPDGEALLSRLDALQDQFDGLLANLTREEASLLCDLLDKLRGE